MIKANLKVSVSGRKRRAGEADLASLEMEVSQFYQFRSCTRKKKLEILNTPMSEKDGASRVATLKEEVQRCKLWEQFIMGWREGLDWAEVDGQEVVARLEREEQVVAEGWFPLEAGVTELLTCPHCRTPFSKGWNKFRHR